MSEDKVRRLLPRITYGMKELFDSLSAPLPDEAEAVLEGGIIQLPSGDWVAIVAFKAVGQTEDEAGEMAVEIGEILTRHYEQQGATPVMMDENGNIVEVTPSDDVTRH